MGPIHPVWALAAIHPRWGNRYEIQLANKLPLLSDGWGVKQIGWERRRRQSYAQLARARSVGTGYWG